MNKREIGTFYEEIASSYLEENGIQILERNFYCKTGELDIIGKKDDITIIFEVKYRTTADYGEALLAVDYKKQRRICQSATIYRILHPEIKQIRYDVIAITKTKIDWIKNAFEHIGYDGFY